LGSGQDSALVKAFLLPGFPKVSVPGMESDRAWSLL
jgi:hypothetical protein